MSSTATRTTTYTITDARYVTSKIKADLKLFQRQYGEPRDSDIDDYGEEAAQLLRNGYLGTVTYGFRRDGKWIVAMRYTAQQGTLTADDRAGGIPRGVDTSGASFYSYLTYSTTWNVLDSAEKEKIKDALPVHRTSAPEPGAGAGYWAGDRGYSSKGTGVARGTFKPL